MESEENIENTVEPDKDVEMDANDETGTELHEKTDSAEDHEQDVVSSKDQGQEVITDKHEESTTQDDEPTEVKTQSADTEEEVPLAHPKPEFAFENPLLKSVMEITPPTPRDSSPLQIAIDKIHPSNIDEDDHLTSPTERKEEEVRLPTGICEFPVGPEGDSDAKMEEEYVEPPMVENKRGESEPIELENTKEHQETETAEQPAQYEVAGSKEEDEVVAPETQQCVDTEPPEQNNDEEFVVVSQEDAPIELAEEYPPIQTEAESPATADETEEVSPETEPATEDSLMETPDNDAEANVVKEEGEPVTIAELSKEEHSPESETQKPEDEQKDIVETEHNEIPRESESAAIGKDVADIPTEEHTPEAINIQSDALPLENEDRVDTSAEVVTDDVSIADAKGVEMGDPDVKGPEENVVDEKSEIVEPDDNPTTSDPMPSDVHPAEETLETNEESLSPAHETEPVESTPEILHVTEPQTEESQPEPDPIHVHNEDSHGVEKREITEETEVSNSVEHEVLPVETVDDIPPESSPHSDLDGPTGEEPSSPFEHTVEVPIGEATKQQMDEIEPPVERKNESPDETPSETHHEQSAEDDTQQSIEPDFEKSVPEAPTHEVADEPVMQEPLEAESPPLKTEEHPVDEPDPDSAKEVVGQDQEHREQTSEEAVEQESSLAEQSEEPVSHESVEQTDERSVVTTERTSNEEEQVNSLEDLGEIPQTPVAALPEDHDTGEEPPEESTTQSAAKEHAPENTKEDRIMPEVAVVVGGVGLVAAAVAESHEGDGSEANESGLEDVQKEVGSEANESGLEDVQKEVVPVPHEEFPPETSVDSEKKLDERHETPNLDEIADEPEASQEEIATVPETPEHVLNVLTEPESVIPQESSELKEEVNDPHLETAEVQPEPVSVENVEEKQDSTQFLSEDMLAPVEPEILAADVEQEKKISVEQAEFTRETATDEIFHEIPSTTEPLHGEVTETPVVYPDEPLEGSELATESKEDTTVTPVETILHGTVAPPSTPLAARIEVVTAAGIIGTSVHTIAEDQLKEAVAREGYLRRSILVEDDSNVPTPEAEDGPTLDDVTDAESVFDVPQVVERVDVSSQKVATRPVVQPSSSVDPIQDSAIASKTEPPSTGETSDSKERVNVEEAEVVAIPAAAAGSIGIMAMATHEKSEQQSKTTAPIDDSIPLIRVDTPKPPTLEVHGPFIEPLKHHVQPDEISPPTPTAPHSPTLGSPVLPIPREPTRLPPAPRPVTSYSWLGALFQPISSDVVEAQRTGWVAISTEIVNEPAVRKSSTRLRRKTKEVVVEQVSLRGQKMSDHQGSQTPGTMWNYVRAKTFKNGRKRVSGWFKRGKTMEA